MYTERTERIVSKLTEYKEGIFVQWHTFTPTIYVFKPEFVEVSNANINT